MPSTQAIGPVLTAVLGVLRNTVALTTYVGTRVYPDASGCDVPPKATYPYVSVESAGETPENTMGGTPDVLKWGSSVKVYVRIASQSRSDLQAASMLGIVKGALDGQPLTVVGYPSVDVAYESLQPLTDLVVGQTTREWIATFDVLVHQ